MYFEAELKGSQFKIDVVELRYHWKISIQKESEPWKHFEISKSDYRHSEGYFSFLFKGVSYLIDVVGSDTEYTVFTRNSYRTLKIYNEELLLHQSLKRGGGLGSAKDIRAGMPGKIIEIFVKEGDEVKANKPLLIMEAMKMENEIRTSNSVKIKEICVKQGDSIESGAVLMRFE